MGVISRPGASLGTRQATELCCSFPNTRNTPARCAHVIHFLRPLRTRESPLEFRVNSVAMDWMALPAPGSVNANAPIISPLAKGGSHRSFCALVPHLRSTMDTMDWTVSTPAKEQDPLPRASFN